MALKQLLEDLLRVGLVGWLGLEEDGNIYILYTAAAFRYTVATHNFCKIWTYQCQQLLRLVKQLLENLLMVGVVDYLELEEDRNKYPLQ